MILTLTGAFETALVLAAGRADPGGRLMALVDANVLLDVLTAAPGHARYRPVPHHRSGLIERHRRSSSCWRAFSCQPSREGKCCS
jgi:hypothetical protein